MAQKNATLRGKIGETLYDLMPKGSVYNTYVDDTVTLADKLQEMVTALNGKVTPEQLDAAMLENGIIKRKLLPEGYPYADFKEIFPEQSLTFPEDSDYQAYLLQPIGLVAGGTYEVTWNGTVYLCVAESIDMEGTPVVIMGDLGMVSGEPTGSHPFIIMEVPPEAAALEGGVYGIAMPLDGSESAVVSICGGGNIPIDKKWLPEGYPYILESGITVMEERECAPENGAISIPALNTGATYKVTWNGVEYTVAPITPPFNDLGVEICWGNPEIFGMEATGEPFLLVAIDGRMIAYVLDGSAAVTLKIVTEKSYIPMDSKYMPGGGGLNLRNGTATGSLIGADAKRESDAYSIGSNSMAVGYQSQAPGNNAFAFGSQTVAEGRGSFSFGEKTKATQLFAVAFGENSEASGMYAFAAGSGATASGVYSRAQGHATIASGRSSHAEGYNTTASGGNAHAEGTETVAASENQHVQGRYNIEDADGKYAHIVGNGNRTSGTNPVTTRSNAYTLDWDGNAWFAGSVEGTALILTSPGGKRFSVTVDDSGSLTAAEITQ